MVAVVDTTDGHYQYWNQYDCLLQTQIQRWEK